MAPPPKYDPPHVQLGRLMVEGRRRGLTFAVWWDEAMAFGRPDVLVTDADPPAGAVRWSTDRSERNSWRAALTSTKGAWRRSFEREEPTRGESAVAFLADAIGAMTAAYDTAAVERHAAAA